MMTRPFLSSDPQLSTTFSCRRNHASSFLSSAIRYAMPGPGSPMDALASTKTPKAAILAPRATRIGRSWRHCRKYRSSEIIRKEQRLRDCNARCRCSHRGYHDSTSRYRAAALLPGFCSGLLPNTTVDHTTIMSRDQTTIDHQPSPIAPFQTGPMFAMAPAACEGYTTTDWTFTYGIFPGTNVEGNVTYERQSRARVFSDFPQLVSNISELSGNVQHTSGFSFGTIEVDTYFADEQGNVMGGKAEAIINAFNVLPGGDFGAVVFSDTSRLPRITADSPPFYLEQDVFFTFAALASSAVGDFYQITIPDSITSAVAPVPEPGSLVLMTFALGGLAVMGRRKRGTAEPKDCCRPTSKG